MSDTEMETLLLSPKGGALFSGAKYLQSSRSTDTGTESKESSDYFLK